MNDCHKFSCPAELKCYKLRTHALLQLGLCTTELMHIYANCVCVSVQADQPTNNDAWPGAQTNHIQPRSPQQAFNTGADTWSEQTLLLHSHQLQVRLLVYAALSGSVLVCSMQSFQPIHTAHCWLYSCSIRCRPCVCKHCRIQCMHI